MELTSKEAFRLGFLARCAEEGLTGPALQARIKSAEGVNPVTALLTAQGIGSALSGAASAVHDVARTGATLAFGVPAAAGLIGGGLGGYALAKLNEPNVTDDDVKAQEIAETYRRYAQRMQIRRKLRNSYRPAR